MRAAASPSAGCKPADITLRFGADMRYFGQQNEVTDVVRCRSARAGTDVAWLRQLFEAEYDKLYQPAAPRRGRRGRELAPDRHRPSRERATAPPCSPPRPCRPKASRKARFNGGDVDTPVYQRRELAQDQVIEGPAIIEERETTIVILPGWTAKVARDRHASWPRRPEELGVTRMDGIELEIVWSNLISIVSEQAKALQRIAFSPIVREAGDLANALFDRRGPHGGAGRHRHARPHQLARRRRQAFRRGVPDADASSRATC